MANEKVNKVVFGDETLIDLTPDTVTASKLALGETAHDASGEQITGTMVGGASNLADLDDVNLTNLSNGQIIKYNSTDEEWQNADNSLANLSDTVISSPTNGQSLVYDSTTQKWVNGAGGGNSNQYVGTYGFTEITSSAADLDNYTTPGTYYKSATNFGLTNFVSLNSAVRIYMSVKKIFDGGDLIQQDVIWCNEYNEMYHSSRMGLYANNAWGFASWAQYESTNGATTKAQQYGLQYGRQYGGIFSNNVACQVGDTTATFTDVSYVSTWTYDVYCDDGTGEPIAISKIEVNASNQVVVTFAAALTAATNVKLHYWT